MADVTLNLTEYLQLLEAIRELPALHKALRNIRDQVDAQRGMLLEACQKWDTMNAKKPDGNLNITMTP